MSSEIFSISSAVSAVQKNGSDVMASSRVSERWSVLLTPASNLNSLLEMCLALYPPGTIHSMLLKMHLPYYKRKSVTRGQLLKCQNVVKRLKLNGKP